MSRNIIAIVGLPGSGKTEVINYLMEKHKWPKVYFGDVTFDEMKARGLEINEKNERAVREDLRARYGLLHYASKVVEKINKLEGVGTILVESLYSWEEYLLFKKQFGSDFKVIAVYTSPEVRYGRLAGRKVRPLTRDEAESRDYAQIVNITQAGPIAMANFTVNNNGSFESLYRQVDEVIEQIKLK